MCFVECCVVGNGCVDVGCDGWIEEVDIEVDMQVVFGCFYFVKEVFQKWYYVFFVNYLYIVDCDVMGSECNFFGGIDVVDVYYVDIFWIDWKFGLFQCVVKVV